MRLLTLIWRLVIAAVWSWRRRRHGLGDLEPRGSDVIHLAPRRALREGRKLGRPLDG